MLKKILSMGLFFATAQAFAFPGLSLKVLGGLSERQNAPSAYSRTMVGAELGYLLEDASFPLELSFSTLIVPRASRTSAGASAETQSYSNSLYLLGGTYTFSRYGSTGLSLGYAAQRQKLSSGSGDFESLGSLALGARGIFDIVLTTRWSVGAEANFIWITNHYSGLTATALGYLKFRF